MQQQKKRLVQQTDGDPGRAYGGVAPAPTSLSAFTAKALTVPPASFGTRVEGALTRLHRSPPLLLLLPTSGYKAGSPSPTVPSSTGHPVTPSPLSR